MKRGSVTWVDSDAVLAIYTSTPFHRRTAKRVFDLILGAVLLVLLAPIMVALIVVVRVGVGSPVLFRQERPGWRGNSFTLYKFRTMTDERSESGELLPDEVRLTAVGRFLRVTSLDELPELINVLRGEMSLVGPRPLLMRYMPYYTKDEQVRFAVRPGITGWAQVHGRNNLPWDERLRMDSWYVEHMSLVLDIKILLRTIAKVFQGSDVRVAPGLAMQSLDEERKGRGY